jgi:uncharacterized protein (DUF362 family)
MIKPGREIGLKPNIDYARSGSASVLTEES